MADRVALIIFATVSKDGGPVYCQGWRISAETVDKLARAMPGKPLEWIWDDTDSPESPYVLFDEDGTGE